jgi:cytochrome c553
MRAKMNRTTWLLSVALVLTASVPASASDQDQAAQVQFFETKVRPILASHCYACHSADTKPSGGLRVDDRKGLLTGGNTGPAVVAGEPGKSLLLQRETHKDAKRRMPQEGEPLSEQQIADLTTWIKDGAAWPAVRGTYSAFGQLLTESNASFGDRYHYDGREYNGLSQLLYRTKEYEGGETDWF